MRAPHSSPRTERLFCRAEVIKPGAQLVFAESAVEAEAGGKRTLISKASVTLAVVAASKIR